MKKEPKRDKIETRTVHAGEADAHWMDSITTPIVQSSSYIFRDSDHILSYISGQQDHFEYGRYGNPTVSIAIKKLVELENAEDGVLFDCGMSAVSTTILALLNQGDHLVITDDAYKKTLIFCEKVLGRFGIQSTVVKMGDYEELEAAIRPETVIMFSESPTNPYLNIADFQRLKKIKDRYGILWAIDSTFGTPYNQRPLDWGADLVIHSATKYLSGHNDILAGVTLGKREIISRISDFLHTIGGILDPHAAYLLLRGLKTFAIRMERLNSNGMQIAKFLDRHPKIRRVYYPGLPNHQHHEIAKRQMSGFGSVVTFEVDSDLNGTRALLDNLRIALIAPSFGGTETLITHPAIVSYYDYLPEERRQLGIKDELLRFSAGIEHVEDLIEDLETALKKV